MDRTFSGMDRSPDHIRKTPEHKTEKYLNFKYPVMNDATHVSLNTVLVINDVMHNSVF